MDIERFTVIWHEPNRTVYWVYDIPTIDDEAIDSAQFLYQRNFPQSHDYLEHYEIITPYRTVIKEKINQ